MSKIITYHDLKSLVESLGFYLISDKYESARFPITIKDAYGFLYISSYNKLQQGRLPERFHKYNKNSIYNIQILLDNKNKKYLLKTKEYINSYQKLIFEDEEGYMYSNNVNQISNNNEFYPFINSNDYTIKNIELWININKIDLHLISKKYVNAIDKLDFIDSEGYKYNSSWNTLQQKHMPERFSKANDYVIENIKRWCTINNKPFELISLEYIDSSTSQKLKWKCKKDSCGEFFYTSWNSILNGCGCGVCEGRQVTLKNCLQTTNPELAKEWHPIKNIKLTPFNVTASSNKLVWWRCSKNPQHEWRIKVNARKYNGCPYCAGQLPSEDYNLLVNNPELCEEWDYNKNKKLPNEYTPCTHQKVWWKCKDCNHEWEASISTRNGSYKTGCPVCFKSKGEQKIKKFLDGNNYLYKQEYTFNDLLSDLGNQLRFDFGIFEHPDKKLLCLIEYDGEFHFKKMYDEQDFKKQQYHDELKNKYCEENNIKLIRIPYWDFDNIDDILLHHLT
jgi:hypothetical protein